VKNVEHVSLNRSALSATVHCLTGCPIGEILGLVISTAAGWSASPSNDPNLPSWAQTSGGSELDQVAAERARGRTPGVAPPDAAAGSPLDQLAAERAAKRDPTLPSWAQG